MIKGLVSTVIPVYNRPKLILEAVASVLAQSYRPIEIIIVDDGSDDPAMTKALEDCKGMSAGEIYIIRQGNLGPGAARQCGLEKARGEFVQFLDSDDLLYPEKFSLSVSALFEQPEAGVVYGKTRYVSPTGQVMEPWRRTGEAIRHLFPSMLEYRWWGTSTPLYRRRVLEQIGPIAKLKNEEDWEFDCRLAALGVPLAWVDEWVSEQRSLADNRASKGGSTEPAKLRDRARARELIIGHALRFGIAPSAPEFQQFIRYSFLVARQCAAAGLAAEAERLVTRLNEVSPRAMMKLYLVAGRVIGFRLATSWANKAHQVLHGKAQSTAA